MSPGKSRRGGSIVDLAYRVMVLAIVISVEMTILQKWADPRISFALDRLSELSGSQLPADHSVVVLLADRDDDEHLGDEWPLRFEPFAGLLNDAYCAGASAVYIDIAFIRDRISGDTRDAETLLAAIRALSESRDDNQAAAFLDQICASPHSDRHTPMAVYLANPHGAELKRIFEPYTVAVDPPDDADNFHYYLADQQRAAQPSPALALYRDYCKRTPSSESCRHRYAKGDVINIDDTLYTPAAQAGYSDGGCYYRPTGDSASSQPGPNWDIWPLFSANPIVDAAWRACPPILTMSRPQFVRSAVSGTSELEGKVVFLGADISFMPDRHRLTFHRALPGVYIQALAFEQLLAGVAHVDPGLFSQFGIMLVAGLAAEAMRMSFRCVWRRRSIMAGAIRSALGAGVRSAGLRRADVRVSATRPLRRPRPLHAARAVIVWTTGSLHSPRRTRIWDLAAVAAGVAVIVGIEEFSNFPTTTRVRACLFFAIAYGLPWLGADPASWIDHFFKWIKQLSHAIIPESKGR